MSSRTGDAAAVEADLRRLLGDGAVLPGTERAFLEDATVTRGVRGVADAVALPGSADEVAAVVAWCYEHDVPVVPRGGGTGFSAGAVPLDGGVVLALDRMTAVRSFTPELWRMQVEAGLRTSEVRRLARENGLLFPPDPGAAEQSQIGGNLATNAGGPHAFKYGVTGAWVTGVEAVVAPGEVITVGGPYNKDVAGYDLKSLLIGSEGTLGVITAAWLRLMPAPETVLPVVAFCDGVASGCAAIESVLGSGLRVAALEYLDRGTLAASAGAFPASIPDGAAFAVIAEADGTEDEARAMRAEVREALDGYALAVHAPETRHDVEALWRWRDGVAVAVTVQRGGKVSEDVVVPLDRLAEGIEGTLEIGARHGLEACSWGHAGDGNLHSTFLVDPTDHDDLERAEAAAQDLFALAISLGGSISGEHGVGWAKRGHLSAQWGPRAVALHDAVKQAFDPKGLLNPGKKVA